MKKIDGRILKNLREERGYSIRQLADMLFISKTTLQRWEKDGLPDDGETLAKVADVFGISAEALKNPPQPSSEKKNEKYRERKMKVEQYVEAKYGLKWLLIVLALPILAILIISCI